MLGQKMNAEQESQCHKLYENLSELPEAVRPSAISMLLAVISSYKTGYIIGSTQKSGQ